MTDCNANELVHLPFDEYDDIKIYIGLANFSTSLKRLPGDSLEQHQQKIHAKLMRKASKIEGLGDINEEQFDCHGPPFRALETFDDILREFVIAFMDPECKEPYPPGGEGKTAILHVRLAAEQHVEGTRSGKRKSRSSRSGSTKKEPPLDEVCVYGCYAVAGCAGLY